MKIFLVIIFGISFAFNIAWKFRVDELNYTLYRQGTPDTMMIDDNLERLSVPLDAQDTGDLAFSMHRQIHRFFAGYGGHEMCVTCDRSDMLAGEPAMKIILNMKEIK